MINRLITAYENSIEEYLSDLFNNTSENTITRESPVIIFSDLHMGNGKKGDDFKKNSGLFNAVIKEYYLTNNYTLVLNGDIEELQKYRFESIYKNWSETYEIFDTFMKDNRLIKLTGNHDAGIINEAPDNRYNEQPAARFRTPFSNVPLFIFHGHQASLYYRHLNSLNTFFLRYLISPIGIKNFSKKYRYEKKLKIENRSYNFSRKNRLISIIGHTHRPLFESLSRTDSLHFSIETLLHKYRKASPEKRTVIAEKIRELKQKYDKCLGAKPEYEPASLMYSKGIPVPCLFNTGCTIGKRGITGIEITADTISLVHWFDSRVSRRFLLDSRYKPEPLPVTKTVHKVVLRKDRLDYISDTINLLGRSSTNGSDPLSFPKKYSYKNQNMTASCLNRVE